MKPLYTASLLAFCVVVLTGCGVFSRKDSTTNTTPEAPVATVPGTPSTIMTPPEQVKLNSLVCDTYFEDLMSCFEQFPEAQRPQLVEQLYAAKKSLLVFPTELRGEECRNAKAEAINVYADMGCTFR